MGDFINEAKAFFDIVIDVINEIWNGLVTMINALSYILEGIGSLGGLFPTFIITIMSICLTLNVVLRIIGR